jgi:hypothetical protein
MTSIPDKKERFMTKSIPVFASLLLGAMLSPLLAQDAATTSPAGPRDLYNTYGKSETAPVPASPAASAAAPKPGGRPGVRVRVELDRDGRARFVSTRTVFRAGDKVRFHFAMNFPGYVVIINQGSSGKRSLLFPYEGVSNHIGRTADYTVPQGDGWFAFDDTPGKEQLTFVMSKREIQEVAQITTGGSHAPHAAPASHPAAAAAEPQPAPPAEAVVAAPAAAPAPAPQAAPAAAPQTEEQEILAALNSRSLTGGRDLKMVEDNTDSYVLATDESLAKPIGFKLTLEHR